MLMANIKLYLDNCCFNRPYDDQNQLRIEIDYTKWQENLYEDMTIEELSQKAMEYRRSKLNETQ